MPSRTINGSPSRVQADSTRMVQTDGTLYDFMLGSKFERSDQPWFIDALSGETRTAAGVKERTDALALGLQASLSQELIYNNILTSSTTITDLPYAVRFVVSLISPNDIDYGTCVWASHKLGCTVAPSNAGSTVDELTYQLRLSGSTAIIAHPNTLAKVLAAADVVGISTEKIFILARGQVANLDEQLKAEAAGLLTIDDLIEIGIAAAVQGSQVQRHYCVTKRPLVAFLCFSSGTTGMPKAVVIPHSAVIANILQMSSTAFPLTRVSAGDKALGVIPLSHMYGLLTILHLCPHLRISSVLFEAMPSFDCFLDILEAQRVNHLFLAPPLVNAFLKHPAVQGRNLGYFKTGLVAAAPLAADREEAFRKLCGPNFLLQQGFGMTETAGLVTGLPPSVKPCSGSVGHLLPLTEAKVVDAHGNAVVTGNRGELCVRGPQLCLGYLDNEEATAAAFDHEGFLRTGDQVIMREDGNIYVVDRLKHIIKHKGFQVSPAELEGHLLRHPFVQDAGVVGRPDEQAGEVPVAFVALSHVGNREARCDAARVKEAIKDHVRSSMSQYKWLGDVYFLDVIPKLPSGKVLSRELKRQLAIHSVYGTTISVASTLGSKGSPATTSNVAGTALSAREKRADAAPTLFQQVREWVSFYRILFAAVLSCNAVGIGFTLAHKWDGGQEHIATFALCNVMAALLARNELFLRILHNVFLMLFRRWPPYWFRNAIAMFLLHLGGLHSGFAVSGSLWLVTATIEFFRQGSTLVHPAIFGFSIFACVLVGAVCVSAYPTIRNTHHNIFENTHRLAGWTGVAIIWILVCLADSWSAAQNRFVASRLANKPDIYIAIALTICIIIPWGTLRKVPVKSEVLSPVVILLRFKGGCRTGLFGRISRHPLKENHAFGISSLSPTSEEHYMCIVGQGDFTRNLIANPPTYLWTRKFKFVGLPIMTSLYRSGVYVVTGSAIGVALSIFLQRDPKSSWHLLWVCSNIESTYGSTVLKDLKKSFDEQDDFAFEGTVTLWDTKLKGRPNMAELIGGLVERQKAEVVFVTSNPKGTAETIRTCRKRGISCLGPIWDS